LRVRQTRRKPFAFNGRVFAGSPAYRIGVVGIRLFHPKAEVDRTDELNITTLHGVAIRIISLDNQLHSLSPSITL
jgi:hypothetical protein